MLREQGRVLHFGVALVFIDFLLNDLIRAYYEARRNKRDTLNQLEFELHLESNLNQLHQELIEGQYELSPGILFINESPVKREIIAADFRDRVVHHLLMNWLYPIFDRQFIHDSYSCRKGKGTLWGIRRVEGFMPAVSQQYKKEAWVLRLDILGYFMAIHKPTLHQLVMRGLESAGYWGSDGVNTSVVASAFQAKLTKDLLQKLIFHDPIYSCELRGSLEDWQGLPASKSLIASSPNCGLPIGNLTSQLFGNIYLNPLDHFIKRKLKIQYYGRYVDDMVLLHSDKNVLIEAIQSIRTYLQEELKLTLHPNKIHLQKLTHGFPYLGAYLKPHRTYIGRRTKRNAWKCVHEQNKVAWPSYQGYMKHFQCHRLIAMMSRKN